MKTIHAFTNEIQELIDALQKVNNDYLHSRVKYLLLRNTARKLVDATRRYEGFDREPLEEEMLLITEEIC